MQIASEPLSSDLRARLISMHSTSWGGCPKIVRHSDPSSLLISTLAHFEPGCKSRGQIIHYRTAKNLQKQTTVLSLSDELLQIDPENSSCSLTCSSQTQPRSPHTSIKHHLVVLVLRTGVSVWSPAKLAYYAFRVNFQYRLSYGVRKALVCNRMH